MNGEKVAKGVRLLIILVLHTEYMKTLRVGYVE